jgi:aminoglycoside/choline kinase family phosphotransferase
LTAILTNSNLKQFAEVNVRVKISVCPDWFAEAKTQIGFQQQEQQKEERM